MEPCKSQWVVLRLYSSLNHFNLIEYLAAFSALAGVGLMALHRRSGWVLNFVSCLCYTWVFYSSKLYGDAGLQVFFAIMQVWGWFHWSTKKDGKPLLLRALSFDGFWNSLLCVLGGSLMLGILLQHGTDTDVPWIDAVCTSGSMVAQILQIGRYRENWLLWILVNLVYVPLFLFKGLPLTALLYALFLLMAAWGWLLWNRKLRNQKRLFLKPEQL